MGTVFGSVSYNDGKNGFHFTNMHYMQNPHKQSSGMIGFNIGKFGVNFEDDIFDLGGIGKKLLNGKGFEDRWRTAALEIGWNGNYIGTQVYTNDPKGEGSGIDTEYSKNKEGRWINGNQLSSPVYFSTRKGGQTMRIGWDSKVGGYLGQNFWHRYIFPTPDFNYHNQSVPLIQKGVGQPYTLY